MTDTRRVSDPLVVLRSSLLLYTLEYLPYTDLARIPPVSPTYVARILRHLPDDCLKERL